MLFHHCLQSQKASAAGCYRQELDDAIQLLKAIQSEAKPEFNNSNAQVIENIKASKSLNISKQVIENIEASNKGDLKKLAKSIIRCWWKV